ncbi:hypothetical protein J2Y03_002877 [Neobacillus niacini]|nr:hypothetical protein [Neobacillus niacini]
MTESTFMEGVGEVHLLSWHRDHVRKALVKMHRPSRYPNEANTCVLYIPCLQGWYRDYKPRPFPGMGFFCFHS